MTLYAQAITTRRTDLTRGQWYVVHKDEPTMFRITNDYGTPVWVFKNESPYSLDGEWETHKLTDDPATHIELQATEQA